MCSLPKWSCGKRNVDLCIRSFLMLSSLLQCLKQSMNSMSLQRPITVQTETCDLGWILETIALGQNCRRARGWRRSCHNKTTLLLFKQINFTLVVSQLFLVQHFKKSRVSVWANYEIQNNTWKSKKTKTPNQNAGYRIQNNVLYHWFPSVRPSAGNTFPFKKRIPLHLRPV